MKKISIYLAGLLLCCTPVTFVSCLDIDPAGSQNATDYWANAGEVEAVLSAAYKAMRTAVTDITYIYWGEMRGNGLEVIDNSAYNIRNGNILPDNSLTKWADMYTVILYANEVIANAPGVVDKDASFYDGEMRSIVGEAHFLRGLCYLDLVRTFLDVPKVTEPYDTDDNDFWPGVTDGNEILKGEIAAIEPYVEYAKEFFSDELYNKGRATRWALCTLLADMNLWLSASDSESDPTPYLQACSAYCDSVINSGQVGLVTDWFSNFYPGNSNESIFELGFSFDLSQTNSFLSWFGGSSLSTSSSRYFYTGEQMNRIFNSLSAADQRGVGGSIPPTASSYTYDYVWKYYGADTEGIARGDGENDQNWIIYRLAEVYLMKAEAEALLGNLSDAIDLVNEVRTRGGSDAVTLSSSMSEYDVIETILDERKIELFAEAKNWYDMLRIGLRYNRNSLYQDLFFSECTADLNSNSATLVKANMRKNVPYSWYLPINTTELSNNPNLEQNVAYANLGK